MKYIRLAAPAFRSFRLGPFTASTTKAVIFSIMTGSSYSLAQSSRDQQTLLVAKICSEHGYNTAATTSFQSGDYNVHFNKDDGITIEKAGRTVARLPARDYASYAKCVEEVTRSINSRPPGPIDPGESKFIR
jgi:hypothetical protein